MDNKLIIIGAGDFSSVIAEAAKDCGYNVVGYIDDNKKKGTVVFNKIKVIGSTVDLSELQKENFNFILAIGNCGVRANIFNKISSKLKMPNIIHSKANISPSVKLGIGNIILAGATINANCNIGNNNIINSNTLIDHDSTIENNCHIAQGTILGSNVVIKDGRTTKLGEHINSFTTIS